MTDVYYCIFCQALFEDEHDPAHKHERETAVALRRAALPVGTYEVQKAGYFEQTGKQKETPRPEEEA